MTPKVVHFGLWLAAWWLPLWSGAVPAVPLYSQPPSSAGGLIASSWVDPSGSDADMFVWDSFMLPDGQAVGEIVWRGGYLYNAAYGRVVDFKISIYGPSVLDYQPNVGMPPLVQYNVGGTAAETSAGTVGGVAMYDYRFVLPTPFQTTPGTRYWLQIEGAQSTYPDWAMAQGTGGNGQHFKFSRGAARYWSATGDTAFTLLPPSASTFSISGQVATEFGGRGIGGVLVSAGDASATTAPTGNYAITGLAGGTYAVSCSRGGYVFSAPQEVSVGPSATGVDFTGNASATISGQVTLYGAGLAGVRVIAGSGFAITGAAGGYTITGLVPGQYYVSCAPLAGYTLAPAYQLVNAAPEAAGINFTASFTANPVPTITALAPSTAPRHSPALVVTVNGAGFVPGSVVRWNGGDRSTQYVSSARLTADVPSTDLAQSGTATVTVASPGPGGGLSAGAAFTIGEPVPVLQSLGPTGVAVGSAAFTLGVNGLEFVLGSVVRWNGAARTTTFVSASRLTAEIPASDVSQPGVAQVTVFNPAPAGGASLTLPFTIAGFRIAGRVASGNTGQPGVTVRLASSPPPTGSAAATLPIPDRSAAGVESALAISGTGTVAEVQVEVAILHGRPGDLEVALVAPDGAAVALHNHAGARQKDLCTGYPVPTAPVQSLSGLAGKALAGTWTLRARDTVRGVSGRLLGWSLSLLPAGGTRTVATDVTGSYAFADLPPAAYTLSALKSGLFIAPSSRSVTVGPDAAGIDFQAGTVPVLTGLTVRPASVRGGSPVTLTATQKSPAPAGGTEVLLFSSAPQALPVPTRVLIAAGSRTVTVPLPPAPVTQTTAVTLVARLAGSHRTAIVTLRK